MAELKTNVMRILDAHKIKYKSYNYESSGAISGVEVAGALGENPEQVFKTLVTVSKSKKNYVFMLPVEKEISKEPAGCRCGEVLKGLVKPTQCPLFGKVCTPNHAVGSCMVSIEGTCAAWYKYGARTFHFE